MSLPVSLKQPQELSTPGSLYPEDAHYTQCSLPSRLVVDVPVTGLAETVTSFLGSGLGRSDMAECTEVRVVGKHGSAMVPSYRDDKRRLRPASMPGAPAPSVGRPR